jgi:hypothetical protein
MPRPHLDGTPAAAPNRLKLNHSFVEKLKPKQHTFTVWDTKQRGLCLVVQTSGHKSWKAVYQHGGKPRWFHIGSFAVIGLADARRLANNVMFAAAMGRDPIAEKRDPSHSPTIANKWRSFEKLDISPTCFLYRHYDAGGGLLYIGMSQYVLARQTRHFKKSEWANTIYQIIIEPFASRDELLEAEQLAIATEFPKFNTIYNGRRQQIVAPLMTTSRT